MKRIASLLLLVLIVALLVWSRRTPQAATQVASNGALQPAATSHCAASTTPLPPYLPPEACQTLTLIAQHGPFPNRQDGVVFGNYENLLPQQPRGYYHEYTVATPGASDRGARRIITGGTPPVMYYYTDDHYRSFQSFQVTP